MAITERLYQFDTKGTLVPADILYVGDSANSFNEVQSTVAGLVGAYPNLLAAAAEGDVIYDSVAFNSTKGIIGTTTNDSAPAGSVGEIDSTIVLAGSAVSLTNATPANVVTLVLNPGDYDVWGEVWTTPGVATNTSSFVAGINIVSATIPTVPSATTSRSSFNANLAGGVDLQLAIASCRISAATLTTTTVYLVVNAGFGGGTLAAFGKLVARRRR